MSASLRGACSRAASSRKVPRRTVPSKWQCNSALGIACRNSASVKGVCVTRTGYQLAPGPQASENYRVPTPLRGVGFELPAQGRGRACQRVVVVVGLVDGVTPEVLPPLLEPGPPMVELVLPDVSLLLLLVEPGVVLPPLGPPIALLPVPLLPGVVPPPLVLPPMALLELPVPLPPGVVVLLLEVDVSGAGFVVIVVDELDDSGCAFPLGAGAQRNGRNKRQRGA